jgi:exo-1,4-beta-D-glucosaminidase
VHFVGLQLRDAAGHPVSDSFYWLAAKNQAELADLERLPTVRLKSSCEVRHEGRECVARVRVTNPADHVAFFVHLVLAKGPRGEEILPVLWDDNYFCLAPGESRQVCARVAVEDLGKSQPALEVGGWNIEKSVSIQGATQ